MSFVKLKARYRAHNYLFCKQSFGHGFVFILKVEKKTSNLDLKWLWQNLRTVMLKMNELIKNQLKRTFTCLLKQCKHKHNTSLAKITKYFEHLAYISTTELK